MGKASSGKKVARAARTGRARSRRRSGSSLVWPLSLTVVVILGVILVVVSRQEEGQAEAEPPTLTDHWHSALGFFVCDKFLPPQPEFENSQGMHSHGDGLIHLHPHSSEVTGKRATLGKYFQLSGVKFSATSLEVPGAPTKKNGDKCGSKPGRVQLKVDGRIVKPDPGAVRLKQGMIITAAFVPKGTKIPDPPSAANLANPSDTPGGTTTPSISLPPVTGVPATTAAPASTAPPTTGGP
jgi:hypothetical protein